MLARRGEDAELQRGDEGGGDQAGDHASEYAAITAVASRLGMTAETLRKSARPRHPVAWEYQPFPGA